MRDEHVNREAHEEREDCHCLNCFQIQCRSNSQPNIRVLRVLRGSIVALTLRRMV